jgi:hypothetical protein
MNMKYPKKWTGVYPQGSKEGDEEQAFFIALARSVKWQWRSTASVARKQFDEGAGRRNFAQVLQEGHGLPKSR